MDTITVNDLDISNKMKKKKYHTVATVLNFNRNIVEIDKIDTLTHNYITAHFNDLVQAFQ